MKKQLLFLGFLALLIHSCASYKDKRQTNALTFPELGSIIKTRGALWYKASEQVGLPKWSVPVKVRVQQLPFNPKSYNTYAGYMAQAGKINAIAYNDSLPYKPKYLRLQLADKIALTQELNRDANKQVLEYLENDSDYKLVTRMDISVPETMMPAFEHADDILLRQDGFQKVQLILVHQTGEEVVDLSQVQIFDFGASTFCWGEDRYHHKRIENIISQGEKCPRGTYKDSKKIKSDRSYLKF